MNTSDGRFHNEVTISGWERHNPSSLWQAVQNDTFCGNN